MLKFVGFVCVVCSFARCDVLAEKRDDIKQEYTKILKECEKKQPLSKADFDALAKNESTTNVKCVFACALKKTGMMDDNGLFSAEGVRKSTEKYLSNDPELMKRTEMFIDACKSVNDAPVADGKKGCDRAFLIYQCTVEKASSFQLF